MDKVAFAFYGVGIFFIAKAVFRGIEQGFVGLLVGISVVAVGYGLQRYTSE